MNNSPILNNSTGTLKEDMIQVTAHNVKMNLVLVILVVMVIILLIQKYEIFHISISFFFFLK